MKCARLHAVLILTATDFCSLTQTWMYVSEIPASSRLIITIYHRKIARGTTGLAVFFQKTTPEDSHEISICNYDSLLTHVLFETPFLRANVMMGYSVQSKQSPCFLTVEHDH